MLPDDAVRWLGLVLWFCQVAIITVLGTIIADVIITLLGGSVSGGSVSWL